MKQSDYPWMYEISKCAPQEALRNLDKAYANFFQKATPAKAGKGKGRACGFPTFKKRSKAIGSFRLTGSVKVSCDALQLPRLGRLRLKEHSYLAVSAKILNTTVSEQAGHGASARRPSATSSLARWYVSIAGEEECAVPEHPTGDPVGVDLGIKTLATCSDGTIFANPRALKHAQRKVRRLEKAKSRRKKCSKNRAKTRKAIASVHARITHIRKDSAHKLTSYLCKNHAVIAIEDLCVAGLLKNHHLAQAVADSNFGEIRRQVAYKAKRYGVALVTVNRFYPSSKTCSSCGWIDEHLTLADRTFICHACSLTIDRDLNAAINLKHVAMSSIDTQNACGESCSGYLATGGETTLVEAGTNLHVGLS